MLAATTRTQRITYALQIAAEDYRYAINFRQSLIDLASDDPEAVAQERATISALAAKRDALFALLMSDGERQKITDTDLISTASRLLYRGNLDIELLVMGDVAAWNLNSAAAHGHLLQSLIRGKSVVDLPTGTASVPVATRHDVALQLAQVALPLNHAWTVWDRRRVR